MKQIDLREGARRQHRRISVFAVLQRWMRGIDGVVLKRMTLERLIGLERFRRTRVDWMLEDFKELFPYTFVKTSDEQPDHFLLMIASRIPFDGDQILGQLKMLKESKELKQTAPRIEEFLMWEQPAASRLMRTFEGIVPFFADEVIYDERFLSSYLSVLVEGQISPHNLPPLQKVN